MIKVRFTAIRIVTSSVLLAVMVGYIVWSMAPRIDVQNQSNQLLLEVSVDMPRSRVVLSDIEPGQSARVFHGANQAKGQYNYIVSGEDGSRQIGSCGRLREHAYGQRLTLRVNSDFSIDCVFPGLESG